MGIVPRVARTLWRLWVALLRIQALIPASGSLAALQPWPPWKARSVAVFCFVIFAGVEYRHSLDRFTFMALVHLLWILHVAAERWSSVRYRQEACDLARCVCLYWQRHPPSASMWASLLRVGLLTLLAFCYYVYLNVGWIGILYGEKLAQSVWFHYAGALWSSLVATLDEVSLLLFVGPALLLAMLLADLRMDCATLVTEQQKQAALSAAAVKSAEISAHLVRSGHSARPFSNQPQWGTFSSGKEFVRKWRSLRVRHSFLQDMVILLSDVSSLRNLFKLARMHNLLAGHLARMQSPPMSQSVHEVELLFYALERRRGCFEICGVFYLDTTTMLVVLGCVSTYAAVLMQFGARIDLSE